MKRRFSALTQKLFSPLHYREIASSAGEGLDLLLVERNTATKPGKKSIDLDPGLTSRWMEKLWDHTGLDISLFDVYFSQQQLSISSSFLSFLSLSVLALNALFPSLKCLWIRTDIHAHAHTRNTWQMLYRASYTAQWLDAVLEQICYIYTPAWLEHLLKPSAKRHSIYLWQRGEQYYLHQFSPGRGGFPVNGQPFFFTPFFFSPYTQFSKWQPFRTTDETHSRAAAHMLINPITRPVKNKTTLCFHKQISSLFHFTSSAHTLHWQHAK